MRIIIIIVVIVILFVLVMWNMWPNDNNIVRESEVVVSLQNPTEAPTENFYHPYLYLTYSTKSLKGNEIKNRSYADSFCSNHCVSFISFPDDNIDDIPSNYDFSSSSPIWFMDILIAHEWKELFDTKLALPEKLWTFSNSKGKLESNCANSYGSIADDDEDLFCFTNSLRFLCVCSSILISL